VAELPVLEIVAATHIVADLTLGLGRVVHDYLADAACHPFAHLKGDRHATAK
jgi:acetoacetate decarboxylase